MCCFWSRRRRTRREKKRRREGRGLWNLYAEGSEGRGGCAGAKGKLEGFGFKWFDGEAEGHVTMSFKWSRKILASTFI